jgi:hypothetical protein
MKILKLHLSFAFQKPTLIRSIINMEILAIKMYTTTYITQPNAFQ